MSDKLNVEQQKAIDAPIQNILISAGAGSGKTSVLTKRICKQLTDKSNKDLTIDKFLIVTFTNNAAKEMKGRIKKALKDAGASNNQIAKVDLAHIETYDAFRLFLINKYGYKIGINNEVSIASDDIISVKVHNIIKEVIDEEFKKEENYELNNLIELYCDSDESFIENFIYNAYLELSKNENVDSFIKHYKSNFLQDNVIKNYVDSYEKDVKNRIRNTLNLIDTISDNKLIFKLNSTFANLKTELNNGLESLTHCMKQISFKGYSSKSLDESDKEIYTRIKEEINSIKNELVELDYKDAGFNYTDVWENTRLVPYLLDLTKKVYDLTLKFMLDNNILTFSLVEKLSNKLVVENIDIAQKLKDEFDVIMIDEFQDTSNLQEQFINAFSKNNVFMVGDVKQSIYGFRNSNPRIFTNNYKWIKTNKKPGQVIDMNTNYRSRKEVLDYINSAFSNLMKKDVGDIDYVKEHMIISGNDGLNSIKDENSEYGFSIISSDVKDKVIDKYEYEAKCVVNDIKNKIENKYQVAYFDKEKGWSLRDCKYSDFAILCRNTTGIVDACRKYFSESGVPLNVIGDESIKENIAVIMLSQIVKVIENINYKPDEEELKMLYVSIVRGFLFSKLDNDIYVEITNNDYKNSDEFHLLLDVANYEKENTLYDTLMYIINKFDFIEKLPSEGNAIKYLDMMSVFLEKLKMMDKLNYNLSDFVDYLDNIDQYDIEISTTSTSDSSDAVVLETMHKSKGLQYNICYFVGLDVKTFKSDKGPCVYSNKFGYWLPTLILGKSLFLAYKNIFTEKEEIEEAVRVYYVALTRVIEQGIFVKPLKYNDENISLYSLYDCSKYYDFIHFGPKLSEYNVDFKETNENVANDSVANDFEIKNIKIDYIPLKEKGHASINQNKIVDENINKLTEFGTHMHLLLEVIDFKNPDLNFIKDSHELYLVNRFLKSDLLKDINKATIFKEHEFIDEENNIDGIIDLMLVYDDHIDIIDYKLKNIDENKYGKQLEVYKNYVTKVFKRNVHCYLFSLIDGIYNEI